MVRALSEEEKKRIIVRDEQVQINLFFGDAPYALGHIVIQPVTRKHDISELTDKHWKILSEWIPRVSNAMKKVLKEVSGKEVQKVYICSFNESEEYTVHFHVIPRYEYETLMGPDLLFHRVKAKSIISPSDRDAIVSKMKKELGIEKKE